MPLPPRVSVVMPVYNSAHTIDRCIASVLEQDYEDLELVVVDDGSDDGSMDLLSDWTGRDSRIAVIRTENRGVSSARNTALGVVEGAFATFIDSDDILSPGAIRLLIEGMRPDVQVVIGGFRTDRRERAGRFDDLPAQSLSGPQAARAMLYARGLTSSVWGKLYSRKILNGHRFDPSLKVAEDLKFNWHTLRTANIVRILNDTVYEYTENPGSVTRRGVTSDSLQVLAVLRQLELGGDCSEEDKRALETRGFLEALQILTRLTSESPDMIKIRNRCEFTLREARARVLEDSEAPIPVRLLAAGTILSNNAITARTYRGLKHLKAIVEHLGKTHA